MSNTSELLYVELTVRVVADYVSNNTVPARDLPQLLQQVHEAFARLGGAAPAALVDVLSPAVPIKKSVTPDYIVCLEDGKQFKSLRRHLLSAYGLTPEAYRAKWGLPATYPMVAPNYAAQRSELAKSLGLGRKPAPKPAPAATKTSTRRKKVVEAA